MTKRQLTHWQRESRLQRFTVIGGIIIIVAVLAVIGSGIFLNKYAPYREIVIKAGDKEYNLGYYIDALSFYSKATYSIYQQFGYTYEATVQSMANSIAQYVGKNQFLKEAAAKLDTPITVSDDEINKYIQDNSLPDNQASRDAVYNDLLDGKLKDYFDKQVPQTAEQRAVLAMFVESQQKADEIKTQLASGSNFQDLAKQNTLESNSKSNDGDFKWVPQGVLSTTLGNPDDKVLDNLVFDKGTTVNVVVQAADPDQNKSIGYWLIQIAAPEASTDATATPTPTPADTATPTPTASPTPEPAKMHVKAILLGSKADADQVKAQLDNGADFATLAKASSQYSSAASDGGDFGTLTKDDVTSKFNADIAKQLFPDDAAKAPAQGKTLDPIADTNQSTKGGVWLVQLTGIEDKTIEGNNRTTLTNIKQQAWVNEVWDKNKDSVENNVNPDQSALAIKDVVARG